MRVWKLQNDKFHGQYGFLDCIKLILSLLVVGAHYISENAVGRIHPLLDLSSSLYVIAVPFFFVCSGFLLFRKMDGKYDDVKICSYCIKLLKMYAWWSVIYILFKLVTWFKFGVSLNEVIYYIITAVTYSTYKTIWFLPATVIGVLITFVLNKKFGIKTTMVIAVIFYSIGCIGASYSFLIHEGTILYKILGSYNLIFSSTRNGIFNGFPFVAMGMLAAKVERASEIKFKVKNLCLLVFLGIAFVAEAFVIKFEFNAENVNTLFLLLPFSYFFLLWSLGIEMCSNKLTVYFRRLSTNIFLCQRLYLTSIPTIFPNSFFGYLLTGNPYIGLTMIIFLTALTSAILIFISNRIHFLRQFF